MSNGLPHCKSSHSWEGVPQLYMEAVWVGHEKQACVQLFSVASTPVTASRFLLEVPALAFLQWWTVRQKAKSDKPCLISDSFGPEYTPQQGKTHEDTSFESPYASHTQVFTNFPISVGTPNKQTLLKIQSYHGARNNCSKWDIPDSERQTLCVFSCGCWLSLLWF